MSWHPTDATDLDERARLEQSYYPGVPRLGYAEGAPHFHNLDAYRLDPDTHTQLTLSGGSSSAYAVWHAIEAAGGLPPKWRIVFCNTGFERRETYDFIADFAYHLGLPVDWIERDIFEPGKFRLVNYDTAARDGSPFRELTQEHIRRKDGTIGVRPLPSDGPRRLCSGELKTKTAHRYLRSLGWGRYASLIGFRADETGRVERRKKQDAKRPNGVVEGGYGLFPMHEAGVHASHVLDFWWGDSSMGAEGNAPPAIPWALRLPSWRGNCTNCFMMSEIKMKMRLALDITSADPWIEMEETERDRNSRFRPGMKTFRQLRDEVAAGDMSVNFAALKRRPECGTCHD